MGFKSKIIKLPYAYERPLPAFEEHDIKFPDGLVRYFLEEFTKVGDKVLDPFAGLGTTFFVCEETGRIPFGVEADRRRYEWISERVIFSDNLVLGDSFGIKGFGFPKLDFSITSPPYMPKTHRWNPLFGGDPRYAGYDKYLKRLRAIYGKVGALMKRGAYAVVQADNLEGKEYTPLVWDIARTLSDVLRLEGEVIVAWEGDGVPPPGYTHCLIFRKI